MEDIPEDSTKFLRLDDDPVKLTLQRENKLISLLKTLQSISEATYGQLRPTGPRISILYGLPKIHKDNTPLRPILSCINSYSYKVAKFFIPLLNPISFGVYTVRDSFALALILVMSSWPALM